MTAGFGASVALAVLREMDRRKAATERRALDALRDFHGARLAVNALRASRDACRCTLIAANGYVCRVATSDPTEYCDPCRARAAIETGLNRARYDQSRALQRLQDAAARLEVPAPNAFAGLCGEPGEPGA